MNARDDIFARQIQSYLGLTYFVNVSRAAKQRLSLSLAWFMDLKVTVLKTKI